MGLRVLQEGQLIHETPLRRINGSRSIVDDTLFLSVSLAS